ncbi:MAG: Spy/CpxP family protein refolding chaperone [Bacteroidota bacterium]|nr:Spy/CpxP family protein refolding chaperone [Bacteroidota bacterium]
MKHTPLVMLAVFLLSAISMNAQPYDCLLSGTARERLKLTDEQATSIRSIRSATAKQLIDIRAEIQKKRLELGDLRNAETPDRAKVEGLSRAIGDLQLKQKMLLFDTEQSILKVLTAEQKKIWKELRAQRRSAQGCMGGGRHRGGMGCMQGGMGCMQGGMGQMQGGMGQMQGGQTGTGMHLRKRDGSCMNQP